jgi:hypothetical protein
MTYPMMWRVRLPDGRLSAMANKSRAKVAAYSIQRPSSTTKEKAHNL